MPLQVEGPAWLVANMFLKPGDVGQRWIQLLNVSHKYPNGDAGFRGLGLPVPEEKRRGKDQYGWPRTPIENIRLRLPGVQAQNARLAIEGRRLEVASDGWIAIPRLELHDVVVVEVK